MKTKKIKRKLLAMLGVCGLALGTLAPAAGEIAQADVIVNSNKAPSDNWTAGAGSVGKSGGSKKSSSKKSSSKGGKSQSTTSAGRKKSNSKDAQDAEDDNETSDDKSDYGDLSIPERLPTAFHDGLQKAQADDDSGDSKSKSAQSGAMSDSMKTLKNNINVVLSAGNSSKNRSVKKFWNVGALYGPIGLSSKSGTSNVTQVSSADKQFLQSYLSGDVSNTMDPNGYGEAYYNFGAAWNTLTGIAANASDSGTDGQALAATIRKASGMSAGMGLKLLDYFSPAPLVEAMYDYKSLAKVKSSDNLLVKFVRSSEPTQAILSIFGGPAPAPFSGISTSMFIVFVILFVDIGISALCVLFTGTRAWSRYLRKLAMKIVIVAAGVPLAMKLYDSCLKTLEDVVNMQTEPIASRQISQNLGLAMWADSNFALPSGTTLTVSNGQFTNLDSDTIKKINLNSALTTGVISQSEYSRAVKGNDNKINSKVVKAMSKLGNNSNRTTTKWTDAVQQDGTPYSTKVYNTLADDIGQNTDVAKSNQDSKDSDSQVTSDQIGYLDNGTMTYSGGDGAFNYSCINNGSGSWGFAPLAAYNFLATDFSSKDAIAVKDNMQAPEYPTVAIEANSYSATNVDSVKAAKKSKNNDNHIAPFADFILSLVALYYGLRAMVTILVGGFGGLLSGGGGTVFGSTESVGRLIGGIVALVGGMFGISLLITLVMQGIDFIYGMLMDVFDHISGFNALTDTIKGLQKKALSVPVIGSMLADMVHNVVSFFLNLIAIIFGIPAVKIPLMAFAQWISGLPDDLAARAAMLEQRILGTYGSTGGMAPATKGMGSAIINSGKANAKGAAQGLSMAGKGMKSALSSKFSKSDKAGEDKEGADTTNNEKDADQIANESKEASMAHTKGKDTDSQTKSDKDSSEKQNSNEKGADTKSKDTKNSSETTKGENPASDSEENGQAESPELSDNALNNDEENSVADGKDATSDAENSGSEENSPDGETDNSGETATDASDAGEAADESDSVSTDDAGEAADKNDSVNPDDSVSPDNNVSADENSKDAAEPTTEDQNVDASQSVANESSDNRQNNEGDKNNEQTHNEDKSEALGKDAIDPSKAVTNESSVTQDGGTNVNKSEQTNNDNKAVSQSSNSTQTNTQARAKDSVVKQPSSTSTAQAAKAPASNAGKNASANAGINANTNAGNAAQSNADSVHQNLVNKLTNGGSSNTSAKPSAGQEIRTGLAHAAASTVGAQNLTQKKFDKVNNAMNSGAASTNGAVNNGQPTYQDKKAAAINAVNQQIAAQNAEDNAYGLDNNTPMNNAPVNNAPVNNAPVNNSPVNNTPNNTTINDTINNGEPNDSSVGD